MGRMSRQELALAGITAIWGTTFLVVHLAMEYSGPFFFVGIRFLVAALVSWVVFRPHLRSLTRGEALAGLSIGVTLTMGYGLQTLGLVSIDSSVSAFFTTFYVPLMPLLQWLVLRMPPRPMTWIGIALAFVGLVFLAGPTPAGFTLGAGEAVTLVATLAFAAQIILISYFAPHVDLGRVTVVELLVGGLLSLALMPATGESTPAFHWVWVVTAVGLGVATTAIQGVMNWAQQVIPPTRATIIYTGEPVWAAVVGWLAGERLAWTAFVGAAFIVGGILISEAPTPRRWPAPSGPPRAR